MKVPAVPSSTLISKKDLFWSSVFVTQCLCYKSLADHKDRWSYAFGFDKSN